MMRLTVIPSDNTIIKDGQPLVFQFASPDNIHAIQWHGAHGFIETTDGKQVRTADAASIQAYVDAYAAEVARRAEIAATPPPQPTAQQIIATLTASVQLHLDTTARTRNYDGILSLCSYAASSHPTFGAEGLAGIAWRDAVWASCYSVLAAVQAGTRTVPTADELLAELPAMVWPA